MEVRTFIVRVMTGLESGELSEAVSEVVGSGAKLRPCGVKILVSQRKD